METGGQDNWTERDHPLTNAISTRAACPPGGMAQLKISAIVVHPTIAIALRNQ